MLLLREQNVRYGLFNVCTSFCDYLSKLRNDRTAATVRMEYDIEYWVDIVSMQTLQTYNVGVVRGQRVAAACFDLQRTPKNW